MSARSPDKDSCRLRHSDGFQSAWRADNMRSHRRPAYRLISAKSVGRVVGCFAGIVMAGFWFTVTAAEQDNEPLATSGSGAVTNSTPSLSVSPNAGQPLAQERERPRSLTAARDLNASSE